MTATRAFIAWVLHCTHFRLNPSATNLCFSQDKLIIITILLPWFTCTYMYTSIYVCMCLYNLHCIALHKHANVTYANSMFNVKVCNYHCILLPQMKILSHQIYSTTIALLIYQLNKNTSHVLLYIQSIQCAIHI